ncbi:MAG: ATP-binding protein [Sulfuricella sp.]|nr:ATP-binding protein [Sulfuricella sp.]
MHSLLQRQLRRYLGDAAGDLPPSWQAFVAAVDEAYRQADSDRLMIEHSLEKMSQELTDINRNLRRELNEKQQTERALRKSEASLARAQQIARLGSWEWSVGDNEIIWSEEVYRIFGLANFSELVSYDDFIGWVHPDDRERVACAVTASVEEKAPYRVEHRIVQPNGAVRHVLEQGTVATDEAGKPVRMYGTVHDITERKLAELALQKEKEEQAALIKKLEEAHNQLLQSEKMASIGQLAAGVAHEINNPTGYVSSNLGTLRDYVEQLLAVLAAYEAIDDSLPPEEQDRIRAVKKRAELDYLKEDVLPLLAESQEGIGRVRRIVQDLKDFSHVDESEWLVADLHKGLDSTLNVVNNEIKYKATVAKEYGNIPPVRCLASQLNQVFMNLLVNAAHAITDKGTITVRTRRVGEEVWVEVEDTGSGIAPENINRIFDPFFTTKPVGKGTGLGLSLSYGIVQKHKGQIEVESELGKGTTFRVRLPVEPTVAGEA